MDNRSLFTALFHSESEDEVVEVLNNHNLWSFDKSDWKILGTKNNQAIVGNQTTEPQNALVEKLTNSVDAMILLKLQKMR